MQFSVEQIGNGYIVRGGPPPGNPTYCADLTTVAALMAAAFPALPAAALTAVSADATKAAAAATTASASTTSTTAGKTS